MAGEYIHPDLTQHLAAQEQQKVDAQRREENAETEQAEGKTATAEEDKAVSKMEDAPKNSKKNASTASASKK